MSQPDVDQYGNPTMFEPGVPLWSDMVHYVVPSENAGALLIIEKPERWISAVSYGDDRLPVAILHAVPHAEETCCGRRQVHSLIAMTRADQRRRGLMRELYRELDRRGYCVLHPYRVDRTSDGAALAAAVAADLDPTGERRACRAD